MNFTSRFLRVSIFVTGVAVAVLAACSAPGPLSLGENGTACAAKGGECVSGCPAFDLAVEEDCGNTAICCIARDASIPFDAEPAPGDLACTNEGGECTTTVCAGAIQFVDPAITCATRGAHCCVPVKADAGSCADKGGQCTSVVCAGSIQHIDTTVTCPGSEHCCVPDEGDGGACAAKGGQCTSVVCAGSTQHIDTTVTCAGSEHCCVPN